MMSWSSWGILLHCVVKSALSNIYLIYFFIFLLLFILFAFQIHYINLSINLLVLFTVYELQYLFVLLHICFHFSSVSHIIWGTVFIIILLYCSASVIFAAGPDLKLDYHFISRIGSTISFIDGALSLSTCILINFAVYVLSILRRSLHISFLDHL